MHAARQGGGARLGVFCRLRFDGALPPRPRQQLSDQRITGARRGAPFALAQPLSRLRRLVPCTRRTHIYSPRARTYTALERAARFQGFVL